MCCTCEGCLSSGIDIGSIGSMAVSIVAMFIAYNTQKRYLAGNVQMVNGILNPIELRKVSGMVVEARKAPNGHDDVAFMLYLHNNGNDAIVNKTFHDLNMVCALICDKALPAKVITCAKRRIANFLSQEQILDFVKAQGDTYPELCSLANELINKSKS